MSARAPPAGVTSPAHGRGTHDRRPPHAREGGAGLGTQRRFRRRSPRCSAVALERETLAREALEADTLRRSDTVKTAVIQAVSHDLRTPLATIEQALDGLESDELALTDDDRRGAPRDDSRRARRLKRSSRTSSTSRGSRPGRGGATRSCGRSTSSSRKRSTSSGGERVLVTAPAELPPVRVDAVPDPARPRNVLENALRLSPAASP